MSSRWAAGRHAAWRRWARRCLPAPTASPLTPMPTHPPACHQGFAEKLFRRLQGGHERFETRLAMLAVVSRAVGVHKLLLLNFYPFLQASLRPVQ